MVIGGSGEPPAHRRDLREPGRRPGAGGDAPVRRGDALRARARERARPERLRRPVDRLPDQRQLHRAPLLARRVLARQRGLGHRRRAVLQLRQGRQEGRAAGVDPRPGVRRRRSRPPAPSRVVTMDLHAPQIQGFFRIPVDDLYALPYLVDAIRDLGLADPVVVSPDAGFAKMARLLCRRGSAPAARSPTRRAPGHGEEVEVTDVIGDVSGPRHACSSTTSRSRAARSSRSRRVLIASRRALGDTPPPRTACSPASAMERLDREPDRAVCSCTDTVENQPVPLAAEGRRWSPSRRCSPRRSAASTGRESISVLFEDGGAT